MAASPTSDGFPKTLLEWRNQARSNPRATWRQFEPFFLSQGYTLWEHEDGFCLKPPNDAPRKFDGFVYRTPQSDIEPNRPQFHMLSPIHCAARTADHRDVLIRLMSIGKDRGERHHAALDRLATGNAALRGDNHVVPVSDKIYHGDVIFFAFPLMANGYEYPWYFAFPEVLDAVKQILEGIHFCHERLVAHLDLDSDNILINWIGGRYQTLEASGYVTSFRTYFPVRYYLNDFELAVTFDLDSDPSTRVVAGLPTDGLRSGEYGRDPAPEMLSGTPYCPFRADIWQLGNMFKSSFSHLGYFSQDLVDLFSDMVSEDPASRPSALQALKRVREIELNVSTEARRSRVPAIPDAEYSRRDAEARARDAEARARIAARLGELV